MAARSTRRAQVDGAAGAPAEPVLHVVAHEECGMCTVERIAREAAPGDSVLFFGPKCEAERLRDRRLPRPLPAEIPVRAIPRVGGSWVTVLPEPPALETGSALGAIVERALANWSAARHGVVRDERAPRFYGPRARILFSRLSPSALGEAGDGGGATIAPALPPAIAWPADRRARVRRELALSTREVALLLAGDPSDWIDGSFVARAVGMAFVSGAPLRLVFSPRMPRVAELARFLVSATGSPAPIVDARADTPWELLPALDGAIVDRDGRATQPVACRGLRAGELEIDAEREVRSAQPALWALACGLPAFVHEDLARRGLGSHGDDARVRRFGDAVAPFAHALASFGREVQATRATSASAASR
jgi:hypothetical protein